MPSAGETSKVHGMGVKNAINVNSREDGNGTRTSGKVWLSRMQDLILLLAL